MSEKWKSMSEKWKLFVSDDVQKQLLWRFYAWEIDFYLRYGNAADKVALP